MGGDFKPLIVGWAATVLAAVMLIDWLDARLYLERHRTAWVLVQLMYFAFGILLVTVVGIVRDWRSKGRDYVVVSRSGYVLEFAVVLILGLAVTAVWNVIRVAYAHWC
jgi:quinol-cytochrome oxidoreductase complex cytochrome b subunit